MNRRDWQNAFGETPAEFRRQLRDTLNGLEDKKMKKRYKLSTAVAAALIAALVLAGAALAASRLGVFKMMSNVADPIVPLDGAEALVTTGLGSAENEYVTLTGEEAVYDGQGALVQFRLTPKDPERYALLNSMLQDAPEDIYDVYNGPDGVPEGAQTAQINEELEVEIINEGGVQAYRENGVPVPIPEGKAAAEAAGAFVYRDGGKLFYTFQNRREVLGRKDGKTIIGYEVYGWQAEPGDAAARGQGLYLDTWDGEAQPDGSVILWASGFSERPLSDTLTLNVRCDIIVGGEDTATGAAIVSLPELPVKLVKGEAERRIALIPEGEDARYRILSANITFTKVRGYFTLEYACGPELGPEAEIDFALCDAEGNAINCGGGYGDSYQTEDGETVHRQVLEIQSFDDLPETLVLIPWGIGEDAPMGRVICRTAEE